MKGFRWQADRKYKESQRSFESASHFRSNAAKINYVEELVADKKTFDFAISACFLSQKILKHMDDATALVLKWLEAE